MNDNSVDVIKVKNFIQEIHLHELVIINKKILKLADQSISDQITIRLLKIVIENCTGFIDEFNEFLTQNRTLDTQAEQLLCSYLDHISQ